MPKGTVSLETERKELKTAPPDGFVLLKRMSYGQTVERRSMLTLGFESDGNSNDFKGEMSMGNKRITAYEFSHCIVDHNLDGDDGQKMDLNKVEALDTLDPKIGQEIEKYIGEMNNFNEEDQKN